ncbi:MAG: hypothetical protein KAS32_27350 [Candidatus Peribacteraceae bacterium]|nr:hypothetical protein [Candidatus Peribacteraceae bacterium]
MSKSAKEIFDSKMEGCPVAGTKKTRFGIKPAMGICGWCVDGKCEAAGGKYVDGLDECIRPRKRGPRSRKPKGHPLLDMADRHESMEEKS